MAVDWRGDIEGVMVLRIAALSSKTLSSPLRLDGFFVPWRTVLVPFDLYYEPARDFLF